MTSPPTDVALELTPGPSQGPDPELEALPEPRRPGRRLTLVTLAVTAMASVAMAWALSGDVRYALRSGPPLQVGDLGGFEPRPEQANTWVRGEALLATTGAVRYRRPLEADTYRLAEVTGNPRVWVQIRVPADLEGPRFVPPTSFVGRLLPFRDAALRHRGLVAAIESASQAKLPNDAWLLIDGEAPRTTRWAIGLVALFVAFAAFNLYGLYRLTRRPHA
jgi:hypothetical protein